MAKTKAALPTRTVLERIDDCIGGELGVADEDIRPEASFVDHLGADSLDIAELMVAIEDEFDIDIPDRDFGKLDTVQKLRDYVVKKVK